jgi:hypothetical protein
MPKQRKPYEGPLEGDLADDILNLPVRQGGTAETVRKRVEAALEARRKADADLAAINKFLAENRMADIVARTLMKQLKRRGDPSIQVKGDGKVILHVAYDTETRKAPPPPVKKRTAGSDLPLLDELRDMAAKAGVNIDGLGRQRRAIFERIKAATAPKDTPSPRLVDEVTTVQEATPKKPKVIRRRMVLGVDPGHEGGVAVALVAAINQEVSVEDFLVKLDTEEEAAGEEQ